MQFSNEGIKKEVEDMLLPLKDEQSSFCLLHQGRAKPMDFTK